MKISICSLYFLIYLLFGPWNFSISHFGPKIHLSYVSIPKSQERKEKVAGKYW